MKTSPVFVVNLRKRTDRKEHILQQFANREEFDVTIVEAIEHDTGAVGLWKTIGVILKEMVRPEDDYVILCEDDHQFTEHYSAALLQDCISAARERQADLVCGGVSWFDNGFAVTPHLCWIEGFTGLQFTVIYRRFFDTILQAGFHEDDAADFKFAELTQNKFLILPFISVQREFGYSDVTSGNSKVGKVDFHFNSSSNKGNVIQAVCEFYESHPLEGITLSDETVYDSLTLPVYVIGAATPEHHRNVAHQFNDRSEFEVNMVLPVNAGLWLDIVAAIQMAVEAGEDLVVLCHARHMFSPAYDRNTFLKQVIIAYHHGVEILTGGLDDFDLAVPVTEEYYWVNVFAPVRFLVLNRSIFDALLSYGLSGETPVYKIFSDITKSKMTVYPLVSLPWMGTAYDGEEHMERTDPGPVIPGEKRLQLVKLMHNKFRYTLNKIL
ncbi:hypothetical protein HF329_33540 [Chitinophaga oryzae]|uniref:Uncharacterized protein n=1 Tax=Chitinophaga oryzae TaxID=2725414 RepID=A0AAE7MLM5_9BACT|nr:hypothetical protein [Chitinophaga oryzae]QOD67373.1 hypothetical protein HF329_33540 [Chitinophaga oryzae]